MHRRQADHSWEALMERGRGGTEECTTDMTGLRKLNVSPVGEKNAHEYSSCYTHFFFFWFS